MSKFQPFCGVAGVRTVEQALAVAEKAPKIPGRKVAIGVVTTPESIRGERIDGRCAKPEDIKRIFEGLHQAGHDVLKVLHLFDPGKTFTLLYDNATMVLDVAGEHCDAIQFNTSWPDPQAIARLATCPPRRIGLILHVGKRALRETTYSPRACADRILNGYPRVFDYVMFDQSDSRGTLIDPEFHRPFLQELWRGDSRIGLAVAGGLWVDNLHRLKSLLLEFPNLSMDAQTSVHDADGRFSVDRSLQLLGGFENLTRETLLCPTG